MDPATSRSEEWCGLPTESWRVRWGLPELHIFASVTSTNDVARELAERGAPHGTSVLADVQTRGRGRRGRGWAAAPGQSLLLSIVLRPRGKAAENVLPLRLGMAAARAIEHIAPVTVGIKWPNDLMIDGRKAGGVLCEGALEGGTALFVVAGIGINVHQRDDDWPPELAGLATSVEAAARSTVAMPELAGGVTAEVLAATGKGAGPLHPAELRELEDRDVLRGRAVAVDGHGTGMAIGVDATGALLVRDGEKVTSLVAGTVRPTDSSTTTGPP